MPRIHPGGGRGGRFEDLTTCWKTVGGVVVGRFVPRRGYLDCSTGCQWFLGRVSLLLRHQDRQRNASSFCQADWIDTGHAHVPGIDDGEQYFLRKENKDGENVRYGGGGEGRAEGAIGRIASRELAS